MRLCRFDSNRLGVLEGNVISDVTEALDVLPPSGYPLPRVDPLIANLDKVIARIKTLLPSAKKIPLESVKLLAPIANPGKIVAAPVNYKKHLEEARADAQIHNDIAIHEIQKIGVFLKATSSLIGASEGVVIRHPDRRNDHEAELVVVIGKPCSRVSRHDALKYVAGYSMGLDMTVRGPEERSMRKSIDTYSVLGPCFVTADEIPDPSGIGFWLTVNGEPRQKANTKDLIIDVPGLIEFASSFYTLQPGDLLYTGTPEGVGPVVAGDRIVTEFDKIGRMEVDVRAS
jgi:2-keto-4-pentenoate hydratase/2-oxohepta-3-ene-1,7-dioic acid hydratase in catechol pathway